jgi:ribosomal protein S21
LEASPGKYFERLYLKKTHHKKGLVEWLKEYSLSSNPSTAKKKKKRERERERWDIVKGN